MALNEQKTKAVINRLITEEYLKEYASSSDINKLMGQGKNKEAIFLLLDNLGLLELFQIFQKVLDKEKGVSRKDIGFDNFIGECVE